MRYKTLIISCLAILLSGQVLHSQTISSTETSSVKQSDAVKVTAHNPTAAMLYSIIPGGGQIYNRKYWKLPIVYGAIGTSSYFVYYYADKMSLYRREFINRRDGKTELLLESLADKPTENILALKQSAQRNMEIAIAATAILYALNIIDAMVDAHLFYFDVSDDLSLQWGPKMTPTLAKATPTCGIGLVFSWK